MPRRFPPNLGFEISYYVAVAAASEIHRGHLCQSKSRPVSFDLLTNQSKVPFSIQKSGDFVAESRFYATYYSSRLKKAYPMENPNFKPHILQCLIKLLVIIK